MLNARQQHNRQGSGLAEGLLRDTRKRHLRQESRSFGCRLLGHKRRAFTQDPSRASLKPLIALYGRDRDRMKVEVEILERQLQYRLAHFAKPDDALVRKVILKNVRRILAVHLHACSGYGGAALAIRFRINKSSLIESRSQLVVGVVGGAGRVPAARCSESLPLVVRPKGGSPCP